MYMYGNTNRCYGCGDVELVDGSCAVVVVMESCFCVVLFFS